MKIERVVFLALLAIFALCAALAWSAALPVAAADPTAGPVSIEPELEATLARSSQANVIVQFRNTADVSLATNLSWEKQGEAAYQALSARAQNSQGRVQALLSGRKAPYQSFIAANSIYIPNAGKALVAELIKYSEIASIELEQVFAVPDELDTTSAPSLATVEWGVSKIRASSAWNLGFTGQGIVVANIDTGVRYTHNALVSHYRGNNGGVFNHIYSWYDPTGTYPSAPGDNNGHGTHTMGTMVGDDGAGNQVGVAPGATWIACKGCSSSSCADSTLLACFDWMLAPGGDTSKRPQVVNNSWGGCSFSTTYRTTINSLRSAGIYPVFSAGNTSNCYYSAPFCGSVGSPGTYKEVTAVGATTSADAIASFSLWGPSKDTTAPNEIKPEVSAPGASIRSSVNTSNTSYALYSGTSMAAPHVAGALAVIWSACPALVGNFDASEQLLKDSATKFAYATGCGNEGAGNVPNNAFGYGRIDVLAAVNACTGTPYPTATPTTIPTATRTSVPTATPTPRPTATPAAPSNLTATAVSRSQINLAWTDNSSNETGFRIYRCKNANCSNFSLIATVGANITTYSNTGVSSRTTYRYRILAYNSAGNSAYSNIASATTPR